MEPRQIARNWDTYEYWENKRQKYEKPLENVEAQKEKTEVPSDYCTRLSLEKELECDAAYFPELITEDLVKRVKDHLDAILKGKKIINPE